MTREKKLEEALICVKTRLQMFSRSHGELHMVVALNDLIDQALRKSDDEPVTLRDSSPANNVTRAAKTPRGNALSK